MGLFIVREQDSLQAVVNTFEEFEQNVELCTTFDKTKFYLQYW